MELIASQAFGGNRYRIAGRRVAPPQLKVDIALTAFIVLSLIGLSGVSAAALSPVAQVAGSEAPPFTLTSINGATFNLTDYQGKVVVLDLMATWCPVCDYQMKELAQLRREYNDVVIMTISVDPTEGDEMMMNFKEKQYLTI